MPIRLRPGPARGLEVVSFGDWIAASSAPSAPIDADAWTVTPFDAIDAVLLQPEFTASATPPTPAKSEDTATGIETAPPTTTTPAAAKIESGIALALRPHHLRLTQVTLVDQTDRHDELAFEREWLLRTPEAALNLPGNLFFLEDTLTRRGLVFVKIAPLPHARPTPSPWDIQVQPGPRRVTLGASDGYAWGIIRYDGGRNGRIAALHAFFRQLRPYRPDVDGLQLSNTWGDRGQDGRISETFLRAELDAAARLGIDVVQIDDGWQKGRTSNSVQNAGGVWEGFYAADPQFWTPHPERFPNGLKPIADAAHWHGLGLGLWFAPDSVDDFAHWQRDVETLVGLHRDYGVRHIKIDGVKLRTAKGERNLRRLFQGVLDATNNGVAFDLDVTAETRPGYFGMPAFGPLFVENRYTDWGRYYPHATLRNLWMLAHYLPPERLRMEWLNHARNAAKYPADDPLAPAGYRPDYLFATVLFSSPLAWFEVQHLPPAYFAEASPLIALWKKHREAIFGGTILPIGEAPDGASWTGFVSTKGKTGYALLFRETTDRATFTFPAIEPFAGKWRVEKLAGDGTLSVDAATGALNASIPQPRRFLLTKLSA